MDQLVELEDDEEELNVIQLALVCKNVYFVSRIIETYSSVLSIVYTGESILSEVLRLSSFDIFIFVFNKVMEKAKDVTLIQKPFKMDQDSSDLESSKESKKSEYPLIQVKNIDGLNILQQAASLAKIDEMNLILEKTSLTLFSDSNIYDDLPFFQALMGNHLETSLYILNYQREKDEKEGKGSENKESNIKKLFVFKMKEKEISLVPFFLMNSRTFDKIFRKYLKIYEYIDFTQTNENCVNTIDVMIMKGEDQQAIELIKS